MDCSIHTRYRGKAGVQADEEGQRRLNNVLFAQSLVDGGFRTDQCWLVVSIVSAALGLFEEVNARALVN